MTDLSRFTPTPIAALFTGRSQNPCDAMVDLRSVRPQGDPIATVLKQREPVEGGIVLTPAHHAMSFLNLLYAGVGVAKG